MKKRPSEAVLDFSHLSTLPFKHRQLKVDGVAIETISLGNPKHPGIVLVHGGLAHANWWVPLMPYLAQKHCVTALSLSGMGNSGWRKKYTLHVYKEEVLSVCDTLRQPLIVAHSFGGYAAAMAAEVNNQIRGLILIESLIRFDSDHPVNVPKKRPLWAPDTKAALLRRFRLMPSQPETNPEFVDYIAAHSIKEITNDQWQWKFDPAVFDDFQSMIHYPSLCATFSALKCKSAYLYGELSTLMEKDRVNQIARQFRPNALEIEIPQAYHHVMVDQPLVLIGILNTLSACWQPN